MNIRESGHHEYKINSRQRQYQREHPNWRQQCCHNIQIEDTLNIEDNLIIEDNLKIEDRQKIEDSTKMKED